MLDIIKKQEEKIQSVEDQLERQEEYSRRNCLVLHGIPETMGENTDEVMKELLREKLDFKLYDGDIDRSHRLTPKYNNAKFQERTYPKPIIIKFTSHNVKHDVYSMKKNKLAIPDYGIIDCHQISLHSKIEEDER